MNSNPAGGEIAKVNPHPARPPVAGESPPANDSATLGRAVALLPPILELCEISPLHFLKPVQALFDQIFPSLLYGQFRLLVKAGRPMAFVNWAWLSDEESDRFEKTHAPFSPASWRGGPNLWFCEIVAREGMMADLLHDVGRNVFQSGTHLRWLRVGPSGELQGVGEFRIP